MFIVAHPFIFGVEASLLATSPNIIISKNDSYSWSTKDYLQTRLSKQEKTMHRNVFEQDPVVLELPASFPDQMVVPAKKQ